MEPIIKIFHELSWIANAIAITTATVTMGGIIFGICKIIIKNKRNTTPSDMLSFIRSKGKHTPRPNKIVIVDDQPENYPISYLQSLGYNVKSIEKISLADYRDTLSHDIIILDITNIVIEDPQQGGLELIKLIKKESPNKPVIAASSKTYDPTLTEFFRLANKQIRTPITEQNLELVISEITNQHYSPENKAQEIDKFLSGKNLGNKQKTKALKYGFKLFDGEITEEDFLQKCSKNSHIIDSHKYKKLLKELQETT